ncbi:Probable multidrug resistance-associated protein lethal(2)03659 [Eumeta japonica]|uniref:Probable multidrug resistance-associated protein lethal(2)03659 n=1 Tax=Eumeta variegata TaxID=151549 RepID=A0A4C1ZKN1_EUMVA|nr:Probable multidrug resistance-associated protein lethal(2)03659 [Eumeta japonica]
MEATQYCMKKNSHDSTNSIMKLFFLWTIKLFKVGSKKDLQIEDLFGPKTKDKSTNIGLELTRHWNTEVSRCLKKINENKDRDPIKLPKPSLFRVLFFTFKWEFVFLGMLGFFNEVVSRLSQPILLGILLSYFRPVPLIPIEHALYAAGALVLMNLMTAISSLKLSATALGDSTPGKVVNLLSNDVNRFDLSAFFVHFLWLAPLAALVTLVLLFQEVGVAGILGVAVVFIVMPLQSYTGTLSARFRLQTAIRTDERVRLMNEIISGVQVIKMYTWEIPFTHIDHKKSRTSVKITKGNAKWGASEVASTLQDIDIEILKGKLVGIIGPVGSGKSSLLQTILGELNLESGSIEINGKISYASQEPWVFGSTVRQNILFGLPYDDFRYNEVVRVCSLQKDFQQFSNGDQTLVGDKGSSLSGGQKARINLARAVYREADIYLLDDPLSAVDAHVGRQLYDKCVRTHLRNKTRLLVTHQLHYLTNADHIIIMENVTIFYLF